jgi:hypothetical protein
MRNPYETESVAICAGCRNDIESYKDALVLREKGKLVYVHKSDPDCLREYVGAITPEEDAANHRPLKRQMSDDFDQAVNYYRGTSELLGNCFPELRRKGLI